MSCLQQESHTDTFFLISSIETHTISINCCTFNNYDDAIESLHEEEYSHLKALQFEKRLESYLYGRYSAKQAVAKLIKEKNLKNIRIKNGIFNQPLVLDSPVQISIAHCEGLAAALAFSNSMVLGIDIEKMDFRRNRVIEIDLTDHEKHLIGNTHMLEKDNSFYLLWTIKESLSKALKTGLTIPLTILEIESIEAKDGYYYSTFTHFFQYYCVSWILGNYVFSITYPKNTNKHPNLKPVQIWLDNLLKKY